MPLSQRVFACPECGVSEDRDVHAAKNMIWFADHHIGVIQLGTERTKVTRGEFGPLIAAAVKSSRTLKLKRRAAKPLALQARGSSLLRNRKLQS
jgi:transposase